MIDTNVGRFAVGMNDEELELVQKYIDVSGIKDPHTSVECEYNGKRHWAISKVDFKRIEKSVPVEIMNRLKSTISNG